MVIITFQRIFFNVIIVHPDLSTSRTLMLIAKIIQKIANLSIFTNQEEFMLPLNKFVDDNIEAMKKFIDDFAV